MVSILLSIAFVNLVVGYGLAVALRWAMDGEVGLLDGQSETAEKPDPLLGAAVDAVTQSATPELDVDFEPEAEVVEAIPAEWVNRLADEAIEAESFVEAAAQVLRLEVGKYRAALVRLESNLLKNAPAPDAVLPTIDRLVALNQKWLETQREATGFLGERIEQLGDFAALGVRLEKVLSQQQSQIESTSSNLAALHANGDPAVARQGVRDEIARLVELAHALRDAVIEALLTTLRTDKRLETIDKKMREDAATGLLSRAGYELAVESWWKSDKARHRLSSAALVDVVGAGAFNRDHGTQLGDRLLGTIGALLEELLRKERGFDVMARVQGQCFLFFFGDTGPRNATSAVERLRQSIVQSTFEHGKDDLAAAVTCAVTEVLKDDDVPALIARLEVSLAAAKKAGRNMTMLDEGEGPKPVDPPDYQITGQILPLDED